MAKYAKNINKQIRLLDVQKQFPGGLKTVDTDDALGKVYLREAENVSLSEFSFLEKRYGTAVEEELGFAPPINNVDFIQGYFEFQTEDGIDKILFVDGVPYIKTWDAEDYIQATTFFTEEGFVYPDFEGTDVFENFELSLAQDNYDLILNLTSTGFVISGGGITQASINPVTLTLTVDNTIQGSLEDVTIAQFGNLNLTLTVNNTIDETIIEEESFSVAFNDLALSLLISDYAATSVANYGITAKLENITTSDFINTQIQFTIVSQQGYSNQTSPNISNSLYTLVDGNIPGNFTYTYDMTAPSTFVQGQDTYSFIRFRINGVLQPQNQNTINGINVQSNQQIEAQYGTLAGF